MSIYHWCETTLEYIEIKFVETIATSSLINANFTLQNTTDATPIDIVNPFKTINITRDYYSISRIFRLWYDFDLAANSSYTLTISNLEDVSGLSIATDTFEFETGDLADIITGDIVPTRTPVDPEDYSIKIVDFPTASLPAENDEDTLSIEVISPDDEIGYYLDPFTAEGRIDIKFNQSPAANFVTSDYFKVQRKLVSRNISRWESIDALVTADTANNYIYIYLPAIDDDTIYGEPNYEYWEPGYKYRVKILAGIGV